ncbi:phosphohydrolase [uncultured Ruminococcus sp.]|uniref:phosphohydrolase n=1 Tax=uncultured Ruminococcus sp. TaxID=165186 RepID=UPI00292E6BD6|nr:phosphohydrolase [uncultured Ruminococcus sp.]
MNPVDCEIDILDIAHALSLMCRGNGHIKTFYSVAQHSIACAEEAFERGYTSIVMMGCLLHDASEAYLSDVTRPIKKDLPQYLQAEDRLQNAIWRRFIGRDLTADEKEKVFEIDDLMLSMEFHQLMPEELNDDYRKLVKDVVCETMPTEIVRDKFLQLAANGYEDFAIHIATEDELNGL